MFIPGVWGRPLKYRGWSTRAGIRLEREKEKIKEIFTYYRMNRSDCLCQGGYQIMVSMAGKSEGVVQADFVYCT